MNDDQPYMWASRNGQLEARLFDEGAEDVLFFFRNVGSKVRGVSKTMSKDSFQNTYRLKPST